MTEDRSHISNFSSVTFLMINHESVSLQVLVAFMAFHHYTLANVEQDWVFFWGGGGGVQ